MIVSGFNFFSSSQADFASDVRGGAGSPLGIVDAWMWAREKKDKQVLRGGPKESLHWIEGYERIAEMTAHLPDTRLVYMADREADLVPLMLRAQDLGKPAD